MVTIPLTSLFRVFFENPFFSFLFISTNQSRFCSCPLAMDEVFEPGTIDVQVDDFVKTKSVSRCKDEFLNVLCEDSDDELVEGEGENARVELDDAKTLTNLVMKMKSYTPSLI
ncbi:unnamed protein product [Lactuca virosa]|uniref:Uncharacterized protein n=1 Tax=Lactuca virosa TaxID=75947 RepID=A0AAU9LPR3_9ASTR|nr:unnamed protein product [Lactuca virosa]